MRSEGFVAAVVFVVCLVIYDAAPVSHSGGDTTWSVHEAHSVVTDIDIDLVEWAPLIEANSPPYWRLRDEKVLNGYPWGGSFINAPFVAAWMAVGEAQGSSMAETLNENIPAPELEGDIAASVSAAVVALLYVWVRRRSDRRLALALAFVFAFATSMLSSVSRALWNVGPALLLVMLVLLALDEHLRAATRARRLSATILLRFSLPVHA